jgi:hypothetical protein
MRTFRMYLLPLYRTPIIGLANYTLKISFFDFFSEGHLDFIANSYQIDALGFGYYKLQPVYNNVDYDAMFLSITVLKGKNPLLQKNVNVPGATVCFYATLLSG